MKKLACQQLTPTIFSAFSCLLAADIKQLKNRKQISKELKQYYKKKKKDEHLNK